MSYIIRKPSSIKQNTGKSTNQKKITPITNYCKPHENLGERKTWNNSITIHLLIFLSLFFLLILISRPALIMDDETITVNQLHQLSSGDQILINECKYGCYADGTPSYYYLHRNNLLGYTLMLPMLSLPVLLFFSIFGDQFRLPIILIWSLIPLLLTILIHTAYPAYSRIGKIPLLYIGAIISMLLLMANLYYYHPFPFTLPDAPRETGAVIFTNCILGSLLGVVIYQIALTFFKEKKIALFGTYVILSCSSYLFWSGTAKDHILSTLMIAIIILCFVTAIRSDNHSYIYAGFFCIGLLAWNRPEVGFGILMAAIIFQVLTRFTSTGEKKSVSRFLFLPVIATAIGSIPLFINNYITTHNLVTPPFWYYKTGTVPQGAQVWSQNNITQSISPDIIGQPILIQDLSFGNLIHLCYSIIPDFSQMDIFSTLVTVFLNPPPGNLSLFPITPIFLAGGLILLITAIIYRKGLLSMQKQDKLILLLLCLFIAGVILPYLHTLQGYIPGSRPGPDIRYLMPLYLVGGLIGLYPFVMWRREVIYSIFSKMSMGLLVLFPTLVTGIIITTEPFGGPGDGYRGVYLIAVYALVLLCIGLFLYTKRRENYNYVLTIALILLISLPLIWQLVFTYYYAIGRFNGYPYWLSFMEYLYEVYVPYPWK